MTSRRFPRSLNRFTVILAVLLASAAASLGQDFSENFDGVAAPALPPGWSATNAFEILWETVPFGQSAPNSVFVQDYATITDKRLETTPILIATDTTELSFGQAMGVEVGIDGGVLEIAIGNGPFQDILAAGGSFVSGGYEATPLQASDNPLSGQFAWSANTDSIFFTTVVALPALAGQTIRLRWRLGTNSTGSVGGGWNIDTISLSDGSFFESFDNVVPPALPAGWTASNFGEALWATSTTTPDTAPNDAFEDDLAIMADLQLDSPSIPIAAGIQSALLSFRNRYDLELDPFNPLFASDGGVLEIDTGVGGFQDIMAAGGSFISGGYNLTIDNDSNPLFNRESWSGNSGGYLDTVVLLPPGAIGQSIQLRWRLGTAGSADQVARDGWRVDTIDVRTCPPTAVATATSPTICANSSTTLQGSGGDSCVWSPATWLSDPNVCNPTVTPNGSSGSVTYTLTVINSNCPPGFNSSTATVTVTSQPLPVAAATASRTSICPGGSATLIGSGGLSCVWTPSTGLSNANSCRPIATPAATTTYSLIVSNNCGASTNTANVTITVSAQPDGPEVDAPTTATIGDTGLVASIVNPNFGSTYVWDFQPASGATITGQGPSSIIFTVNTAGPLILSVTENNGACLSDPTIVTIDVNPTCSDPQPPPSALIQASGNPDGPVTGIDFLDLSWTEPTPAPLFYLFSLNGGPTQSTTETSVPDQPPTGSNDAITLSVRSACTDEVFSEATEFTVSPAPPGAEFSVPDSVGVGTTVTFTDTSEPDATSWLWIFGDGGLARTQSATHIYEAEGTYTVWLVASNGAGVTAVSHLVTVTPAGALAAHARTLTRGFDATKDPMRRRLSDVRIAGPGRTWLRIASREETQEAIVFLRFLAPDGAVLATRRLAVNPGDEAVYDLGAYGLRGIYTVELVSFRRVESTLVEPARTRTVKERRVEQR
ncbi:MAG: PKD domain-containing protein [Acidobacteriota bacterium]